MTANPHQIALDPAAQAFVEATDEPFLYDVPPEKGRAAMDECRAPRSSSPRSTNNG
jgi:acetyl esterase